MAKQLTIVDILNALKDTASNNTFKAIDIRDKLTTITIPRQIGKFLWKSTIFSEPTTNQIQQLEGFFDDLFQELKSQFMNKETLELIISTSKIFEKTEDPIEIIEQLPQQTTRIFRTIVTSLLRLYHIDNIPLIVEAWTSPHTVKTISPHYQEYKKILHDIIIFLEQNHKPFESSDYFVLFSHKLQGLLIQRKQLCELVSQMQVGLLKNCLDQEHRALRETIEDSDALIDFLEQRYPIKQLDDAENQGNPGDVQHDNNRIFDIYLTIQSRKLPYTFENATFYRSDGERVDTNYVPKNGSFIRIGKNTTVNVTELFKQEILKNTASLSLDEAHQNKLILLVLKSNWEKPSYRINESEICGEQVDFSSLTPVTSAALYPQVTSLYSEKKLELDMHVRKGSFHIDPNSLPQEVPELLTTSYIFHPSIEQSDEKIQGFYCYDTEKSDEITVCIPISRKTPSSSDLYNIPTSMNEMVKYFLKKENIDTVFFTVISQKKVEHHLLSKTPSPLLMRTIEEMEKAGSPNLSKIPTNRHGIQSIEETLLMQRVLMNLPEDPIEHRNCFEAIDRYCKNRPIAPLNVIPPILYPLEEKQSGDVYRGLYVKYKKLEAQFSGGKNNLMEVLQDLNIHESIIQQLTPLVHQSQNGFFQAINPPLLKFIQSIYSIANPTSGLPILCINESEDNFEIVMKFAQFHIFNDFKDCSSPFYQSWSNPNKERVEFPSEGSEEFEEYFQFIADYYKSKIHNSDTSNKQIAEDDIKEYFGAVNNLKNSEPNTESSWINTLSDSMQFDGKTIESFQHSIGLDHFKTFSSLQPFLSRAFLDCVNKELPQKDYLKVIQKALSKYNERYPEKYRIHLNNILSVHIKIQFSLNTAETHIVESWDWQGDANPSQNTYIKKWDTFFKTLVKERNRYYQRYLELKRNIEKEWEKEDPNFKKISEHLTELKEPIFFSCFPAYLLNNTFQSADKRSKKTVERLKKTIETLDASESPMNHTTGSTTILYSNQTLIIKKDDRQWTIFKGPDGKKLLCQYNNAELFNTIQLGIPINDITHVHVDSSEDTDEIFTVCQFYSYLKPRIHFRIEQKEKKTRIIVVNPIEEDQKILFLKTNDYLKTCYTDQIIKSFITVNGTKIPRDIAFRWYNQTPLEAYLIQQKVERHFAHQLGFISQQAVQHLKDIFVNDRAEMSTIPSIDICTDDSNTVTVFCVINIIGINRHNKNKTKIFLSRNNQKLYAINEPLQQNDFDHLHDKLSHIQKELLEGMTQVEDSILSILGTITDSFQIKLDHDTQKLSIFNLGKNIKIKTQFSEVESVLLSIQRRESIDKEIDNLMNTTVKLNRATGQQLVHKHRYNYFEENTERLKRKLIAELFKDNSNSEPFKKAVEKLLIMKPHLDIPINLRNALDDFEEDPWSSPIRIEEVKKYLQEDFENIKVNCLYDKTVDSVGLYEAIRDKKINQDEDKSPLDSYTIDHRAEQSSPLYDQKIDFDPLNPIEDTQKPYKEDSKQKTGSTYTP